MKKYRNPILSLGAVLLGSLLLVVYWASLPVASAEARMMDAVKFDEQGNLIQPKDQVWRSWIYVGTPVTPNDLNPPAAPFPEFHNVYIDPKAYKHYKKTGKFPQGTVLIKELVSVRQKQASSGKGYFQGDFIGLEATVKDAKRFPKEPGNWAYFTFSHKAPPYPEIAKRQPTAACNTACHQAKAEDDWVFTQFYPVLRAAKGKGR
jgi:hypothetical protein